MGRKISDHRVNNTSNNASNDATDGSDSSQQYVVEQNDSTRIVVLHGDVNEHSISQVIAHLLHLSNVNQKPIRLVMSTYGGSIDEMFSLYDVIKFLPCAIHTIALGKVMSAGVLLLAAGQKGNRVIGKSARIMLHPVSGGVFGNVFEAINEVNEQARLQNLMVDALKKETSMSHDQIDKIMKAGHDYYITPSEAIKLGIVDRIVGD